MAVRLCPEVGDIFDWAFVGGNPHAAVDAMWSAYRTMYASLQASLWTWNALAPAAAGE